MSLKHVLTILSLLGVLGLVLFLPSLIDNPSHQGDEKVSHPLCSLNQNECTYSSSIYGDVTVSVSPKDFQALKPLKVTLTSQNHDITNVLVSLDGKEMFMGVNQTMLSRSNLTERWEGVITIPVCTIDAEMVWLFSVTLNGLDKERLVFDIKSKH